MAMRIKKGRIKAEHVVFVMLVVAVICCIVIIKVVPRVQDNLDAEVTQEEMDSKRTVVRQGETMKLDSGLFSYHLAGYEENPFDWTGALEVTVLSADLYESWDDAPLKDGSRVGVFNRDLLEDAAADSSAAGFLLCEVKIRNIDASVSEDDEIGKGYLLASFIEPAITGELDYLYCRNRNVFNAEHPEYVLIKPGDSQTFTFGWYLFDSGKALDSSTLQLRFDNDSLASCILDVRDRRGKSR